jgi:hypothetical protein
VKTPHSIDPERKRVLQLYVERFNRRDWDGLRELITADAQPSFASLNNSGKMKFLSHFIG